MLKAIWKDAVWSKVIASAIIGIFSIFFFDLPGKLSEGKNSLNQSATVQSNNIPIKTSQYPTPIAINNQVYVLNTKQEKFSNSPPISLETLKNLTYQIGNDLVTLHEGKRLFVMDAVDGQHSHEYNIYAELVDHAFGDIDDDQAMDAVAVITSTDGGSGIFYSLALVLNNQGTPEVVNPTYLMGDRLVIRSISASKNLIEIEVLMHSETDGLCCPSKFRKLQFRLVNKALQCETPPCSEY
jgi:hypothetical protein